MNFLRSSLFLLWAVVQTVIMAPFIVLLALTIGPQTAYRLVRLWRQIFLFAVRWILGIRTVVLGQENMPKTAAVLLSKHQSAWETVALQEIIYGNGVFVMKKELVHLPFFGWALAALRMISIDRKGGRDALDRVAEQGRDRLAKGYYVILFPEGTRVAPGLTKRYQPGGAYLAIRCGAQVVPVAHNAGECWPRNAFVKHPGTITMSIGQPIDATGMNERELNAKVEQWIEAEMRRLSPHRYPDAAAA